MLKYRDALAAYWSAVNAMMPYDEYINYGCKIAREINNRKYRLGSQADVVATKFGEDFLEDYASAISMPLEELKALRKMVCWPRIRGRCAA